MKITDALLGEHGAFYVQFNHLENCMPHVETLTQVQSLGALLAAALASHAQLENELLFAALDPHLGEMGPVAVMRTEHEKIESGLSQIQEEEELEGARHLLLHILAVARQHFAKEEQVLFPIALQALGTEELARLGAQWAERRRVVIS